MRPKIHFSLLSFCQARQNFSFVLLTTVLQRNQVFACLLGYDFLNRSCLEIALLGNTGERYPGDETYMCRNYRSINFDKTPECTDFDTDKLLPGFNLDHTYIIRICLLRYSTDSFCSLVYFHLSTIHKEYPVYLDNMALKYNKMLHKRNRHVFFDKKHAYICTL
jgi:hypothetical protein